MLTKQLFSKTTRNLLFYCMFYYVLHDIYFAYTMNWSFYRSIAESEDSCRIMFHGSECFFLYLIGVFLRVLLLYSHREYNLKSRYNNKSNMYASMAVSFLSFVQSSIYTFYIFALFLTLKFFTTEDGLFYGNNLILWFYSFPLAGLALPCSILLSYCGLNLKKRNKIGIFKITTQDSYFKSLTNQWMSTSRTSIAH
ncbi:Protein CBR-SRA-36 [Caenorhabditis briggsae]|uniref:Protein CBR-SRA-36 n=1 Tax=Caenorhabditis briggsae TaxID=6238 RepID=A8XHQ4_CAEBR|nr:Protein CBR-SRA-36 [Caenorhabditis briggsae]CAP32171.2 Protein CBR-SRA-36 [Caenorhabditis briggsae]